MSDAQLPQDHPESVVTSYAHYIGQLIHWGAAEWKRVFHGGPDPGPVPTPNGSPAPAPPVPPVVNPPLPPTSGVIAWTIDKTAADLVSEADLLAFAAASNQDVPRFHALWPHVGAWTHVAVAGGQKAPAGAIPATLVATLPEAPEALAYHSADNDGSHPFIRVGVKVCLDNGVSWQSAADHETKETLVDPGCQAEAIDPKTKYVWALEVSDPVESTGYDAPGTAVQLSDAVGPSFFDMDKGPLDLTGEATAPFTIAPGGYAVIDRHDGQGPQSVFGEKFPEFRKRHVRALERAAVTPRRRQRVA